MTWNIAIELYYEIIMWIFTFFFTFPKSEGVGRGTSVAVATALNQTHAVAVCMYVVLELKNRLAVPCGSIKKYRTELL